MVAIHGTEQIRKKKKKYREKEIRKKEKNCFNGYQRKGKRRDGERERVSSRKRKIKGKKEKRGKKRKRKKATFMEA